MKAAQRISACAAMLLMMFTAAWPQTAARKEITAGSAEQKTAAYFESVRNQPSLLMDFLQRMPKGGDLHNHLSGAVYAESFVRWAVQDGLCVDRTSSSIVPPPCDAEKGRVPAATAYQDVGLYTQLLGTFSMRGWRPGLESGHDHFFATFG